jgi:hypothetical protein
MSRRGKSSGKGFLLKLIIAALAALAASAVFKKKVLAPAPATDYRLPSTPPPNPSAAMGPEESTPLTEQEKIRLQGSAGISSAGTSTVEAATAVDEAVAAEPEANTETQPAEASSAAADEPVEDESKSDLELLEGFDIDEEEGETGDDGESPAAMGIAAEAPADALTSGKGFVYPAEGTHECPEDYPIKGNASSRIYHRPGESSYDATIPEICFASDTAANAAGYRERKR